MLNLLRRVSFPEQMNVSADVIKADILRHVNCYRDLIKEANYQSRLIVDNGKLLVQKMRASARDEAAKSVKEDFDRVLLLSKEKEQFLISQVEVICKKICISILDAYFTEMSELRKIEILISELLRENINSREMRISCHPARAKEVEAVLAKIMSDALNIRTFSVFADDALNDFELRLKMTNGSEIRVSIDNILSLLKFEVEQFINENQLIRI